MCFLSGGGKSQIWTELKGEHLPSLLAEKDQLKTFLRVTVDSRTARAFRGYNLESSYPLTPHSLRSSPQVTQQAGS